VSRISVDVEVPDGMRLGFSRDTAGALRALLFDKKTSEFVGHAELFEPVRGGRRSGAFGAVALLGIVAVAEAAPHLKRWWSDTPILVSEGTVEVAEHGAADLPGSRADAAANTPRPDPERARFAASNKRPGPHTRSQRRSGARNRV
jgi:hypothetical protein